MSLTATVSRWTLIVPVVLALLLLRSGSSPDSSAQAATVNLPCGSSLDSAYDAAQVGDLIQLSNCSYTGKTITGAKAAPGVIFDLAGSNQGSITLSGAQNVELRNGSGTPNLGCQPGRITLRNYSQSEFQWFGVCNVSWIGGEIGPSANDTINYISDGTHDLLFDGVWIHDNTCVSSGCHFEAIRFDHDSYDVVIRNSVFQRNKVFHVFLTIYPSGQPPKRITFEGNYFDYPTSSYGEAIAQHDTLVRPLPVEQTQYTVRGNRHASGVSYRGPFWVFTDNVVGPLPPCFDGQDNDGDGLADYPADPNCGTSTLSVESGSAAPPVNTALPVITGSPQAGQTLTSSNGTWTNGPTAYTRQWRRCNSAGTSCANIAGATGASYVLAGADAGSTLRVVVTATNAGGSASATSAQTSVVTAVAPSNTVRPDLSGVAVDGQTLTTSNGTWSGTAPLAFSYSWRRCDVNGNNCSDIAGATGQSYLLTAADVGSKVFALVTATNGAGSASLRTYLSATVAPGPPVNTQRPALSGSAREGQTLTTSTGTWTGTGPLTYAFSWRRCDVDGNNCVTIVGATGQSYVLTAADVGSKVYALVTATNSAGSASQRTYLSAAVAAAP